MNLIVDIGNTLCKLFVMNHNNQVVHCQSEPNLQQAEVEAIVANYGIKNAIACSTRDKATELFPWLTKYGCINLCTDTQLPITIGYNTPQTLGADRIAAAVGATCLFPKSNVLVIDIGTAITIDFISSNGCFNGGTISPGPQMRAKALNQFTKKLPLVSPIVGEKLLGKTTSEAIGLGIGNGIKFEIDGYIARYSSEYEQLKVIITGGEADLYQSNNSTAIVKNNHLVAIGLNNILMLNQKS